MKIFAAALLMIAAAASGLLAYGQVNNPSIVIEEKAPFGPCTQNLPDQQVIGLGTIYTCQSGTWTLLGGGGGGGSAIWGQITGTLSYQTDLQSALNGKQPALSLLPGTYVNGDLCTYSSSGTLLNCNTAAGGGGSSVGSQGQVQAAGSTAGSFQASSITDNGTTVSTPENFAVGSGGTPTQISTTALPIANLPAASTVPPVTTGSNTTHTYKQVLDGTTASDCTVGGGGNLHWCYSNGTTWIAAVPAGTVTGVTGTAPVSSSGGTAPVISMHVADASDNGYLASADWSTFNGKQPALSLLPGTYANGDWCSYASSGTLLNCNNAAPQAALGYTPAHSGANSDILSLAGLTTPLSVAQGGNGTASPGIQAGTNVTVTGTWPTQTVAASGGGGGGTVNSGTQWSPAYYAATGTAVSGTTPFTGLEYWSGSGAPAAATAANVVGAIGWTVTGSGASQAVTAPGTLAAGTTTPTTIGSNGVLLNGVAALQSQTSLYNYYSGGAGNLTGTGNDNTANGYQALHANTTGYNNTANGYQALYSNTTGGYNTANGYSGALRQHHRHLQHREWVRGAPLQHHRLLQHREWVSGALLQHHRLLQHREWVLRRSTPTPPAPTTPRMGTRRDNTSRMA